MKTIALVFAAILLIQLSTSQSCAAGWYAPGGTAKCAPCSSFFGTYAIASCAISPTLTATLKTSIAGAAAQTGATVPTAYCTTGKYNKVSNSCEYNCKLGCAFCQIDYDFCTDCTNGFYWNNDYTCIPAGVGLLAASLAFLVVGLIFLVASCCLVNKSRK